VLFPTADTVDKLEKLNKAKPTRPLVVVNKQWNVGGNIISDFGIGPWKARREKFVGQLEDVYCLKQLRVLGENVRILFSYGGKWQVRAGMILVPRAPKPRS
jgi:hypothetical protein